MEQKKEMVEKISKLKDEIYSTLNGKWENDYGRECFESAIKDLKDAMNALSLMY